MVRKNRSAPVSSSCSPAARPHAYRNDGDVAVRFVRNVVI